MRTHAHLLCLYFFNYTTAFYLSEPRPSLPLCTLPRLPPWRRSSPGRGRRSCCGQRTSNRRYLKRISMNSSFYALYHTVSTHIIVQYMKYIFFYKASPWTCMVWCYWFKQSNPEVTIITKQMKVRVLQATHCQHPHPTPASWPLPWPPAAPQWGFSAASPGRRDPPGSRLRERWCWGAWGWPGGSRRRWGPGIDHIMLHGVMLIFWAKKTK